MKLKDWLDNPKKGPVYMGMDEIIDVQPAGRSRRTGLPIVTITIRVHDTGKLMTTANYSPEITIYPRPNAGPDLSAPGAAE